LTDCSIIALLNYDGCEDDEDNGAGTGLRLGRMERMNHNKGVKALEAALAFVEQEGEVTVTDVMLLRCWYDLTTGKSFAILNAKCCIYFIKNQIFRLFSSNLFP
jgi:hypothetical protein